MLDASSESFIKVRVPVGLKEEASLLFEEMGLNISEAVRLFLLRSLAEQRLPFDLITERQPLIPALMTKEGLIKELNKGVEEIEGGKTISFEDVKSEFSNLS